uniref:tyrosine-type recombinase/integrase n=1 Tax=Nonomuraea sp. CA-251285 TaxID=3240002 RepID=UPI003F490759
MSALPAVPAGRRQDQELTPEAAALLAVQQAERDETLTDEAADLVSRGLADNTRDAYERIARTYAAWCERSGRTAMPATEATLASFVAFLATTPTADGADRAPSSIDQALACVLALHDHAQLPKPGTKQARLALRAYRKDQACRGRRKRQSPPITLPVLRQLVEATPADTIFGVRDRAGLILGFSLWARRVEVANLDIGDLAFTERGLDVHIAQSKTDQDAAGVDIGIWQGQHDETDPVQVVRAWLAVLAEHGVTDGPLLRYVDQHDRIAGAVYPDGKRASGRWTSPRMTGHGLNLIVKKAAARAKLAAASTYTWHGLRSGGATWAAERGVPMSVITKHGRWADGSPVAAGYIRQVDRWNTNPTRNSGL